MFEYLNIYLYSGYILLEDIYTAARREGSLASCPMDITIPLDHVDTVGQWGRLNLNLFIPGLKVRREGGSSDMIDNLFSFSISSAIRATLLPIVITSICTPGAQPSSPASNSRLWGSPSNHPSVPIASGLPQIEEVWGRFRETLQLWSRGGNRETIRCLTWGYSTPYTIPIDRSPVTWSAFHSR